MGIWNRATWLPRLGIWLWLVALSVPASAATYTLTVSELRDDPPASEVLSGQHDARLLERERPSIQQRHREVQWWRVDAAQAIAAEASPKLLLRSPFLYRVEAWAPGADRPSRHALYGEHADARYASRALVIDLPQGVPAGQPVWLRVEHASTMLTAVSIEPLDEVHRDDLAFVAWRTAILASLAVLAVLGLAFWAGTGERSYAYFGAMLACAIGYNAAIGGDLRLMPWADALFGSSPLVNRFFGSLGVVCSNLFQRGYLELPRKLPVVDRVLAIGTATAAISAISCLFGDWSLFHWLANFSLLFSAMVLLVASAILAIKGDRPGRVVLVSWLPLMVFSFLAATQMMGIWQGPDWMGQGLAASFVAASLLLAIGLSDKLLQLRRDRDHASRQAVVDPVTKALNRHGIEERLFQEVEQARSRKTQLSIAFVDLDHFKAINDRHGHALGDQCLRIVTWRVRNILRRSDTLGRYGGDEFLVVMPGRNGEEALSIAERMRVSVNCRPLSVGEASVPATLSIGVAELAPGEAMDSLFERADAALYTSKSAGRDRATAAPAADGLWTLAREHT